MATICHHLNEKQCSNTSKHSEATIAACILDESCYMSGKYLELLAYFFALSSVGLLVVLGWLKSRRSLNRCTITRYVVLVIYLAGLAALTIAPSTRFRLNNTISHVNLVPFAHSWEWYRDATIYQSKIGLHVFYLNLVGNIALFLPFGFLLRWMFKQNLGRTILVTAGISIFVELIQLMMRVWHYYRHVDVDDVLLNIMGALIGGTIALLIRKLGFPKRFHCDANSA